MKDERYEGVGGRRRFEKGGRATQEKLRRERGERERRGEGEESERARACACVRARVNVRKLGGAYKKTS